MSTGPVHDWHGDGSECMCVAISVGPHTWTREHQSDLWFESPGGTYTGTDRGVPLLLGRIEQLETELRLVAGWFMKGDDGGLLIDHGGGWISGVEFPNLSTYIDEVQP